MDLLKDKYIIVEMGTYFNTVTKPRIEKVTYSDNWKNGKPQDKVGVSQIIKYQVLESYEDTLNNLYLKSPLEQGQLDLDGKVKDAYKLHYKVAPSIDMIFAEGNPSGIKSLLASKGMIESVLRLPLVPASDNLKNQINTFVKEF